MIFYNERMMYKGWVPNIATRLSFGAVASKSSYPCEIALNMDLSGTRHIFVVQERHLSDILLPFKWLRSCVASCFYNDEVNFKFVCQATTQFNDDEGDEELIGDVWIFLKSDNEKWGSFPKKSIDSFFINISNLDSKKEELTLKNSPILLVEDSGSEVELEKLEQEISSKFQNIRGCEGFKKRNKISFTLKKNGVITLISHQTEQNRSVTEAEIQQAFFFLRDLAHNHRHHHRNGDQLTLVYNTEDNDWYEKTIKLLYRAIVMKVRINDRYSAIRAKGVLAYARSFLSVMNKKSIPAAVKYESLLDRNIEDSLSALDNESKKFDSKFDSSLNRFLQINFSVLGLFLALFSLLTVFTALGGEGYLTEEAAKYLSSNKIDFPVTLMNFAKYVTEYSVVIMMVYCALILPLSPLRHYYGRVFDSTGMINRIVKTLPKTLSILLPFLLLVMLIVRVVQLIFIFFTNG